MIPPKQRFVKPKIKKIFRQNQQKIGCIFVHFDEGEISNFRLTDKVIGAIMTTVEQRRSTTMKELSFKRIATEVFERALTACELAFGCLVIRGTETVELFTFVEDDDVVIIDEMLAAGAELIYNRNPI